MTDAGRLFPIRARRPRGRVTDGLEQTIKALRDTGRLEPVDAALVALNREAAAQLQGAVADADEKRYTIGTLIGRYSDVLKLLLGRPEDDAHSLEDLLAGLVDAENRPAD